MAAESVAPWLALAGLGALHGLNPFGGWPLLLAKGQVLRGLLQMAGGHAASLLAVAGAVVAGVARGWLVALALVALALAWRRAGPALLAFISSACHGTGLMLVPALLPLCLAGTPARALVAGGSWPLVAAALLVHLAAMLLTALGLAALPSFWRCFR